MAGREADPSSTATKRQAELLNERERITMLSWTLTFLVIALIAGLLGFAGLAGLAASIAKVLFVIFLVLFLVSLVSGRRRGA